MNALPSLLIGWQYASASGANRYASFISRFSIFGIALGVMSLITVISVMDGFERLLKQRILSAVPHVLIHVDQSSGHHDIDQAINALPTPLAEHVLQRVNHHQTQAIIQVPGDLQASLLQGIESDLAVPLGFKDFMQVGSWSALFNNKYGIVIGQALAFEHGLTLGDKVRVVLSGRSHYTPVGRMPVQRAFTVVGIFSTDSEIDQHMTFVNSADLHRLLKTDTNQNTTIRLVLDDPFTAQSIVNWWQRNGILDGVQFQTWHDSHGNLFDAVQMEKNMMWILLSLIVAVAAFNIISSLVILVNQKQGEIAILKTLGMAPKSIAGIFIIQGFYTGLAGTLLGGIVGVLLVSFLNPIMVATGWYFLGPAGVGLPIALNLTKVATVILLAVLLTILASLYPAIRASRLAPADTLRHE